jgi:3-phenylpropionate/trans-cinnamate dioxygenase ferredoxin subunit
MTYRRALPFDAVSEGAASRVVVEGHAVLVSRIGGIPHAVTDVCPHNGASLADGALRDGCVTCPAHLWRFSLIDGARQGRPEVRLAVFACRVADDGWVEVNLPDPEAPTSLREVLLAHARQGPVR